MQLEPAIYNQTEHNAAVCGCLPQIQMPKEPFPALLVIDGQLVSIGKMAHPCSDLAEFFRL